MRLFVNEGIIVLRDFVQNIFRNVQSGTKLIDFMKSIDFYESKSLLNPLTLRVPDRGQTRPFQYLT